MKANEQPNQNRPIRVFVSSTFRDMHAERDHLVTVVFPELRERCERLGLEFFDVDLRWGVPEKKPDGEQANSWEYFRQWNERVEPLFVCILGHPRSRRLPREIAIAIGTRGGNIQTSFVGSETEVKTPPASATSSGSTCTTRRNGLNVARSSRLNIPIHG